MTAVIIFVALFFSPLADGTENKCIDMNRDAIESQFDTEFEWNKVPKLKDCLEKGLECTKGGETRATLRAELKVENTVNGMHCYVDKGCQEYWTHGKIGVLLSNVAGLQSFRFQVNFTGNDRIAGIRACLSYEQENVKNNDQCSWIDMMNLAMAHLQLVNVSSTEFAAELRKKNIGEYDGSLKHQDIGKLRKIILLALLDIHLIILKYEESRKKLPTIVEDVSRNPDFSACSARSSVCSSAIDGSEETEATWVAHHVSRTLMLLMESGANSQVQKQDWDNEKADLQHQLNVKNNTISELEEEAKNSSARIQKLVQEKEKYIELNEELNALNESLTKQVYNLSEKIANLTMQMKAQNESFTEQSNDLGNQISILKESNRSLAEENAKLNNEVRKLEASLKLVKSDWNETNLTLNFHILNLTAKIAYLSSDNADLRSNVSKLKTRGREIEGRLNTQSSEISVLKYETLNMTAEILQLNETISNMTVQISELEDNVSNADALNAYMKRNLSRLMTKLESRRDAEIGFPENEQEDIQEDMQDRNTRCPSCDQKVSKNMVSKTSFILSIVFLCMFLVSTLLLLGHLYFLKVFQKGKSGDKTTSSEDSEDNKGKPPPKAKRQTWPKREGVGPKTGAKGKRPRKEKSMKETTKEKSESDWIPDVSRVTSRDQKEVTLSKPLSTRRSERSRSVIPTIPLH